jgi:hypothetical protein
MRAKTPPKQKRKQKTFRFEFKDPNAGPILDLAEDAAINKAIAKATKGGTKR